MKTKIYLALLFLIIQCSFSFSQTKQIESVKQESSISYKLSHLFHTVDAVSKDGYCKIDVEPNKKEIKKVFVQVEVTTFNSGNSSRDSHAMEVVDALSFPDAKFVSTSITQNGDSLKVFGKLTFHGITRDIIISASSKWSNNKLIVNGSFDISLTAFNVERPALAFIKVNDILKFTLTQVFNLM